VGNRWFSHRKHWGLLPHETVKHYGKMELEKKHYWWIGGTLAGLAVLGGILWYRKKNKSDKARQLTAQSSVEGEPVSEMSGNHFPLKEGAQGYEVKVLQRYMNSTCKASMEKVKAYPLEENGVWDERMSLAATNCTSVKRSEVDEEFYTRIHRDLSAGKMLP
jgi:hypothetical protein